MVREEVQGREGKQGEKVLTEVGKKRKYGEKRSRRIVSG